MLKQRLEQKQVQKLTPQQIQIMKLLQIPAMILDQRIKEELEINPALEEIDTKEHSDIDDSVPEGRELDFSTNEKEDTLDMSDLSYYMNEAENEMPNSRNLNYDSNENSREIPIRSENTFHDGLLEQFRLLTLTDEERKIGECIIGNLDENGYMRMDIHALSDDILFNQNIDVPSGKILKVLEIIQQLDPAGIGARNLQECLLLQLKRKSLTKVVKMAYTILEKYFDDFSKKNFQNIISKMNITEKELREANNLITKLNPKPGNVSEDTNPYVIPDFTITETDGELLLHLNNSNIPEMRINKSYSEMLNEYAKSTKKSKSQRETVQFIKQKIEAANSFIDAIKQRNETLLKTMQAIMEYQYEYFLTGNDKDLRPMKLENISVEVGLDISTISRVVNSKYVQTPFGVFLLKDFFSKSIATKDGDDVSNKEIMSVLQECVEQENSKKPITDDQLMEILNKKGYKIARRTVSKYRENLGIPVARLRKKI